jgi:antitoxin component YwqK of YwqJK toxin-antitoxin module
MTELNLAEIPYETGEIHFRYARYMSGDGSHWIRHGLFRAFHRNGSLASEGQYAHGKEHGIWRDYHENGRVAAEGLYESGEELGQWQYWNEDGSPSVVRSQDVGP